MLVANNLIKQCVGNEQNHLFSREIKSTGYQIERSSNRLSNQKATEKRTNAK